MQSDLTLLPCFPQLSCEVGRQPYPRVIVSTLQTNGKKRHRLLGTDAGLWALTWLWIISGVSLLSIKEVGFRDLSNLPVITHLRWWRQDFEPSGCHWSLYPKHALVLPAM